MSLKATIQNRKKYGRVSYEMKLAMVKYLATHSRVSTAKKFKVSMQVVCVLMNQPVMRNPQKASPPEPATCKIFGCGKHLSRAEQLAGDYCTKHMKRYYQDPTNFISY